MDLGSSAQCHRLYFNSGPLSAILVLQHLSDMKTVKDYSGRLLKPLSLDKNYFYNVELETSVLMLLLPSFFNLFFSHSTAEEAETAVQRERGG